MDGPAHHDPPGSSSSSHVPRAINRPFNESFEQFLTDHAIETLLGQPGVDEKEIYMTHTTFNGRPAGGKYCIRPDDKEARTTLMKLYFQRMCRSGPFSKYPALYLNELALPVFRFYADIDMKDTKGLHICNKIAEGHHLKLWNIFGETLASCVEDTTGVRPDVLFSRRTPYKLHYNFPTVLCNADIAKAWIQMALDRLKQTYEKVTVADDWTDIFDTGVYRGGLRVLGSRKFLTQPTTTTFPEDEVYRPICLTTGNEIELTETLFENYLIHPNLSNELEREAYTEFVEVHGMQRGTSSRRVGGARLDASVDEETVQTLFTYVNELRNGGGGIDGAPGRFGNMALNIQKIALMTPSDETTAVGRKRTARLTNANGAEVPHGFWITLCDRQCPFVNREHKRKTSYLYLSVTSRGTHLRCFNEECKGKQFPDAPEAPVGLSPNMRELFGVQASDGQVAAAAQQQPKTKKKRLFTESEELEEDEREAREAEKRARMDELGLCYDFEANDNELDRLIYQSLNKTDWDVGSVVYCVFKNVFRVSNAEKPEWFMFRDHRWQSKGVTLKVLMSTYLLFVYEMWKTRRVNTVADGNEDAWDPNERQAYETLVLSLKRHGFKSTVAAEAAHLFASLDEDFVEKLDTNTHLFCFKNGVLDLRTMEFRPGRPSDYISLCCGHNYVELSYETPEVQQVLAFFRTLFPVESTNDYMLQLLSRCLAARMSEVFYILSGSGSNGKSKLITLIQETFGDYAADLPTSFITSRRNRSSQASPELMMVKGARFVSCAEPDSGESESKINMGIVKQITGGDKISARQLFSEQQQFCPQFTLFLCTNDAPSFSDSSIGSWRRIKFLEMLTRFTKEVKHSYERLIDPDLEKKIPTWSEAFLWVLVDMYRQHRGAPLDDCEAIIQANNEFRREMDHLTVFTDRHLSSSPEYSLVWESILDLYTEFCAYENVKHGRPHGIKRRMRELFGEPRQVDEKLYYKAAIKVSVSEYATSRTRQQQQQVVSMMTRTTNENENENVNR